MHSGCHSLHICKPLMSSLHCAGELLLKIQRMAGVISAKTGGMQEHLLPSLAGEVSL